MAQIRRAQAHWSGDLASGGGAVSAATSDIFHDQPIDVAGSHRGVQRARRALRSSSRPPTPPATRWRSATSSRRPDSCPERVDVSVDVERRQAGGGLDRHGQPHHAARACPRRGPGHVRRAGPEGQGRLPHLAGHQRAAWRSRSTLSWRRREPRPLAPASETSLSGHPGFTSRRVQREHGTVSRIAWATARTVRRVTGAPRPTQTRKGTMSSTTRRAARRRPRATLAFTTALGLDRGRSARRPMAPRSLPRVTTTSSSASSSAPCRRS